MCLYYYPNQRMVNKSNEKEDAHVTLPEDNHNLTAEVTSVYDKLVTPEDTFLAHLPERHALSVKSFTVTSLGEGIEPLAPGEERHPAPGWGVAAQPVL